jgi:hypothetical protein
MTMWSTLAGIAVATGLSALLVRQLLAASARRRRMPELIFGAAKAVLEGARIEPGPTLGSHRLTGTYRDLPVQVQTVVDTLNVRKLPSLWLMVTIPDPLPLKATFDLMMRPSGPTTFSNFDDLPVTMDRPVDFPEHAVLRTDDPAHVLPAHVVTPHLAPFFGPMAKELLIAPKGLRMVVQMAEADRARYGVFRQAEFGEVAIEAALLRDILDRLIALRAAILDWHRSLA